MKRITGIGGIFFKAKDPVALRKWYQADLHALIRGLRADGCNVLDRTEESQYGKFGWVIDPDGNKVELWDPPAGQ